MRHGIPLALAVLALGGCNGAPAGNAPTGPHGRYEGVGVFDAGDGWKRMISEDKRIDSRATFKDDDHVIVVVDTDNGEVRQCGDHSGYCVAMNPWNRGLAPSQQLPVALSPATQTNEEDAAAASNVETN